MFPTGFYVKSGRHLISFGYLSTDSMASRCFTPGVYERWGIQQFQILVSIYRSHDGYLLVPDAGHPARSRNAPVRDSTSVLCRYFARRRGYAKWINCARFWLPMRNNTIMPMKLSELSDQVVNLPIITQWQIIAPQADSDGHAVASGMTVRKSQKCWEARTKYGCWELRQYRCA